MKSFTVVAALFAGIALAHSNETVSLVTETVTAYTTFCPEATTLTHGSQTITVTAPTTITLACPGGCTVTRPVYSSSSVICSTSTVSAGPSSTPIGSAPYQNGTISTAPAPTVAPTGSVPTSSGPSAPITTGGANMAASGAGLAAALGFAAFFL